MRAPDGAFEVCVPLVVVMNGGSKTLFVDARARHVPSAFGNALGTLVQLRAETPLCAAALPRKGTSPRFQVMADT